MYGDLIGSRARVAIQPYDSHGNLALTHLAVITVLLAGAYRIVQERNRAFVTSGQSSSSMPMH